VWPAMPAMETTSKATGTAGGLGHVVPEVEHGRTC
jgi:hypothetical protein